MIGNAFQVKKFPKNLHDSDGQHLMTLHQLICGVVFGWNFDLQRELERLPPPYSTCPQNIVVTKILCNFEKYTFRIKQVQYLGYIIDEKGFHLDPTKRHAIWDWSTPTTLTKLHISLIVANFYHKLILGFSHATWPLSHVTKGGVKAAFVWYESQ